RILKKLLMVFDKIQDVISLVDKATLSCCTHIVECCVRLYNRFPEVFSCEHRNTSMHWLIGSWVAAGGVRERSGAADAVAGVCKPRSRRRCARRGADRTGQVR